MLFLTQPEGVLAIVELFPFTKYFSNAPQPVFKGESFEQDWDIAEVTSSRDASIIPERKG